MYQISKSQAQQLALYSQGLLNSIHFGIGKKGVTNALQQLSYVQIDSISVVQRAHHHTFWTRLPDYKACFLADLQAKDKEILEYWSHAAAYLPMETYRFCLPRMNAFASGERHWFERDEKMMSFVLDRIRGEGALKARDFKRSNQQKVGQWWDWKPAKKALEQLFMEGKLMVARRENFQKVYDLPENVLSSHVDTSLPSPKEFAVFLIHNTIQANGFASLPEITYLRRGIKLLLQKTLNELLEAKTITTISIEGINNLLYYTTQQKLEALQKLSQTPPLLHLLSPFDNALIQRRRIAQIFDFQYTLECYVPKNKRVRGYFCLPILWGTQFVGQLDAKADRKTATLYLRHLLFENTINVDQLAELVPFLAKKIRAFAAFNQCQQLVIEEISPIKYRDFVSKNLLKVL